MATYIFQKIADEGKAEGIKSGSEEARDWYRDKASSVRNVNTRRELRNRARTYNKMVDMDIGRGRSVALILMRMCWQQSVQEPSCHQPVPLPRLH